ncbi:MAG: GTPase domain-containing protein [Planctomycetaceae bacterium]|nr:GTPase domain-containing protein [Planctomycetaceae bacterium]
MLSSELTQLELLAEVDALLAEMKRWSQSAPDWPAARTCAALVKRLTDRAEALRVRMEAPLVVATLGGTGTGKSTLVNALVGAEVTQAGRERPTTRRPTFICRPDLRPEMVGIDPETVHIERRDLPMLAHVVIVDCPDPDTTEEPDAGGTNLARLRALLPHCDVLLITATQQKYRSARVLAELASAAPGARLVFVQTHADQGDDIRADWRDVLAEEYAPGDIFLVDSLAALADARAGLEPRGDFGRLVDLLTRELAGAAAARIRRANFLDLVEATLAACREKLDAALPAIGQLEGALAEQRARMSAQLIANLSDELLKSRRTWENRLLAEVASRWGFSPFSLLIRTYQGLGGLVANAMLLRMRSTAQVAIWGALEGGRRLRSRQQSRSADAAASRAAAWSWDAGELRTATIILDGYAGEAGLTQQPTSDRQMARQADEAASAFVATASGQLQKIIRATAGRHSGWFTRFRYELLLGAMLALLLYRCGKNFFWDSWLAPNPQPVFGTDFYLASALWLTAWCALLLWAFTNRLRRGLNRQIASLAQEWTTATPAVSFFSHYEQQCRSARRFRQELTRLENLVAATQAKVVAPSERLGHRIA